MVTFFPLLDCVIFNVLLSISLWCHPVEESDSSNFQFIAFLQLAIHSSETKIELLWFIKIK